MLINIRKIIIRKRYFIIGWYFRPILAKIGKKNVAVKVKEKSVYWSENHEILVVEIVSVTVLNY